MLKAQDQDTGFPNLPQTHKITLGIPSSFTVLQYPNQLKNMQMMKIT